MKKENLHHKLTKPESAKKSETIEVRISYETKQALQKKARREKRTVSDVVRGLIALYLEEQDGIRVMDKILEKLIMLKTTLIQKPVAAMTTALSLAAGSFLFFTAASAQDVQLDVRGGLHNECSPSDSITGNFRKEVALNYGETLEFILPDTRNIDAAEKSKEGSLTRLQVMEAKEGDIALTFTIFDGPVATGDILATPRLIMRIDSTASIQIGTDNVSCLFIEIAASR